ncbi:tetratricopeptide repeat protein [Streptomyces sp. NPDC088360]|uniref:tetratricopeptide repeat protein n=1 Tax=Streptomyces sp. NPDC088360 TaxID=3154515 RepID=UPI00344B721D
MAPSTLECQVDLAILYWSQGDRSRATALLEQSLTGCQIAFGAHHAYTASVNDRLSLWQAQHKRRWWSRIRCQSHPIRPARTGESAT